MDAHKLLDDRIDDLRRELKNVELTLGATEDKALKARVKVRFEKVFTKQDDQLEELKQHNSEPKAKPLDQCWVRFRELRDQGNELIAECLAFRLGELTRTAGLDDGMCSIADHLLDSFSLKAEVFWNRLTILDRADLSVRLTQIIRLRFPTSIWDLPFVAHEFGHFLGTRLADTSGDGPAVYAFRDMLDREGKDPEHPYAANHLREFFSDLFATYALGPAYACACILRRFDPTLKTMGSHTHPGDDARIRVILRFLEMMDAGRGPYGKQYNAILPALTQAWAECHRAHPRRTFRKNISSASTPGPMIYSRCSRPT